MRCVDFLHVMIFCSNFARWLQKIVTLWCDVLVFWMLWSFVTTLKMITKDSSNMWCVGFYWMCWFFLDVLVFLGCWFFLDVLVFLGCVGFWDSTIFCNNYARWLQKIVATSHCNVMRCAGFLDVMIFCNNFTRWLQKIVTCEAMCWFSKMLWSFVTTLQDDYKR